MLEKNKFDKKNYLKKPFRGSDMIPLQSYEGVFCFI